MRATYLMLPLLLIAALHAVPEARGLPQKSKIATLDDLAGLPCNGGAGQSYISYQPVMSGATVLFWRTRLTCRQPNPVIRAIPESFFFSSSTETTFTLRNVGIGAASLANFQVVNTAGVFTVSNNTCDGAVLNPDQSCTFKVTWTGFHCGSNDATIQWTNGGGATGASSVTVSGIIIC